MQQKTKDKDWIDENGQKIPFSRTTPAERKLEVVTAKLLKKATTQNTQLKALKNTILEECAAAYNLKISELKGSPKPTESFTLFNFDRTIKVLHKINKTQQFDDTTIKVAQEKLHEFIEENVESKNEFITAMVNSAFETSRGQLDPKKVTSLLRYRSKIKDQKFHEALDLIEKAIRIVSSKSYTTISVKDEAGEYQNIDLNFSSI